MRATRIRADSDQKRAVGWQFGGHWPDEREPITFVVKSFSSEWITSEARIESNNTTFFMSAANLDLASPILRRLLGHWRALPAGVAGLPAPRALDPVEIPWALGAITLVDVEGVPPDCEFRFALDGSWQVERYGFDMTGKTLTEFPEPETRDLIRRSYMEVVRARRPIGRVRDLMLDGRPRRYEALLLPFGADGRVTRLAVALDFESASA